MTTLSSVRPQPAALVDSSTAACGTSCPVARAARIIEGKWTTLIVRELLSGCKRFSELQRGLSGVSAKVLTERLKMLEDEQVISKTVYPTVPPKTEYQLTPLGFELEGVIRAMAAFGISVQRKEAALAAENEILER